MDRKRKDNGHSAPCVFPRNEENELHPLCLCNCGSARLSRGFVLSGFLRLLNLNDWCVFYAWVARNGVVDARPRRKSSVKMSGLFCSIY